MAVVEADEAVSDIDAVWFDPDPSSRPGRSGQVIGYSHSRRVRVVLGVQLGDYLIERLPVLTAGEALLGGLAAGDRSSAPELSVATGIVRAPVGGRRRGKIMCWACDHPGSTYQDRLDHMRGLMVRHGWAVQGVEGDRIHPPYAYTLGLTECGLPELVVTGMALPRATTLLNRVAEHVVHAEPPTAGERITLVGGRLIEIVELAHPDAHLDTAVALFGPELRALQLVWADERGHWPWERGFRGMRGGQPVLGPRRSTVR